VSSAPAAGQGELRTRHRPYLCSTARADGPIQPRRAAASYRGPAQRAGWERGA
jgi:hypothetical protein